jgi:hypothetical protein
MKTKNSKNFKVEVIIVGIILAGALLIGIGEWAMRPIPYPRTAITNDGFRFNVWHKEGHASSTYSGRCVGDVCIDDNLAPAFNQNITDILGTDKEVHLPANMKSTSRIKMYAKDGLLYLEEYIP